MTATTHYAFSYLICSAAGFDQPVALTASIAALLPDIDHPASLIGRIFHPLSKFIQRKYGHRTITHSLFAVLVLSLALSPLMVAANLLNAGGLISFSIAIIIAYSSHIFIDLFNRSGIRLLSPFSQKEYISFRTSTFRILVSSWQEYIVLFVIIFLAFSVTGEAFSFTKAARSVGRLFYKTYYTAFIDFQNSSNFLCVAKVEFFDFDERQKKTEDLTVLNMFSDRAIFLRNNQRFMLKKDDITEILIDRSNQLMNIKKLSGSNPSLLNDIPAGAYISGSIDITNYIPDLKSNDFISIEKRSNGASLSLRCASPEEVLPLLNISGSVDHRVNILRKSLCSYQIAQLGSEEIKLKSKIGVLRDFGLFDNYGAISKLSADLKKIQSKIYSLEIKDSMGSDAAIIEEINRLQNGAQVIFEIFYFVL